MYSTLTGHPPTPSACTCAQTHTYQLQTCMCAHILLPGSHTHAHTGKSKQERTEPGWQRMVQLCIKEDTEVHNYSNCASCHNTNTAALMLYPINQESVTFASAQSCIVLTGKNNLTKLVTTPKQKKKKKGFVCCKQQIPTEYAEWIYIATHGFIRCQQVGWERKPTKMWQRKFGWTERELWNFCRVFFSNT